jgi:hydroxymethylbilane synthase
VLSIRPDLSVIDFRGNVETRLRKLKDGVAEATFLAVAGLNRLGLSDRITAIVPAADMLPAAAQGAIGLEIRTGDKEAEAFVAPLNDVNSQRAVTAERAFLARLEGSCRTPIAAHATIDGERLSFRGQVLSLDGQQKYDVSRSGAANTSRDIGLAAADEVLSKADPALLVRSSA